MKTKIELVYNDIDNNMNTTAEASVFVEVKADDYSTVYQLAEKLRDIMGADHFVLD